MWLASATCGASVPQITSASIYHPIIPRRQAHLSGQRQRLRRQRGGRSSAAPRAAAQQQEAAQAAEERRSSGAQASTSTRPSGAAPLSDVLLPPADPSSQARNTAVDKRFQPFLDEWDRGFMDAEEDPEGYWLEVVEGELPLELRGTLYRNGPGRFTIGEDKIAHPYDGDGLILSIALPGDGRGAYFRSRFVRTAEFEAESLEKRILFRGTFATQRPGGQATNAMDVYVKNTSNTNVVHWGGRLWSLFEAGQPHRLDPATLETQGLETLGGQLSPGLPIDLGSASRNQAFGDMIRNTQERVGAAQHMPGELYAGGGDAVTAHPHADPVTGRLVTFSYRVGPSIRMPPLPPYLSTELTFWELEKDFSVAAKRTFRLSGFAFLHDFAMTENYYCIFQNPVTVDNVPYVTGRAPAAACVRWVKDTPTLLHLIPRPGKTDAQGRPLEERRLVLPPLFIFHHANAFEAEGGRKVVIDSIHYDSLPAVGREALAEQQIDPDVAFGSRLRRVEVDLQTGVLRISTSFNEYLEMVAINEERWGRPHRYVYGYASQFDFPSIGIAKVDMQSGHTSVWTPGFQTFALEPKFVPRPGATEEDDGWLLTVSFHSGTQVCNLVVLDARDVEKGPVAVLRFKQPVPSGLHGCWTGEYYGPQAAPS